MYKYSRVSCFRTRFVGTGYIPVSVHGVSSSEEKEERPLLMGFFRARHGVRTKQ